MLSSDDFSRLRASFQQYREQAIPASGKRRIYRQWWALRELKPILYCPLHLVRELLGIVRIKEYRPAVIPNSLRCVLRTRYNHRFAKLLELRDGQSPGFKLGRENKTIGFLIVLEHL